MTAYSQQEDNTLFSLMASGSDDAFKEIYNRYWKKLYSVSASKLNNSDEAQEIVQEIFLDIWNRRHSIELSSTLSAYLSVALKYKIINLLAKKHREQQYALYASKHFSVTDDSTQQLLSLDELKERLAKHVAALPEQCRLIFTLSREHGLTTKEISEQLNISPKTVEAHITKALSRLKLGLGQFFYLFF